ncbi:hypothetical protein [Pseudorhodoplanes sp.]|uniref:hypothetical protein n=1 Tax=Pseudorhodoplanes sp. TaxID=1934341 RepID=UPI003D0C8B79
MATGCSSTASVRDAVIDATRRTTNEMSLRLFLSIPFLVEAETVENGAGGWVRRASYPELPDCRAESPMIETALEQLERRRVECILEILRSGRLPPVPREPLADCDPEGVLVRLGFGAQVTELLDLSGSKICDKLKSLQAMNF